MSDTVNKIKDRLTIVEVVQQYVKLTRAGKYYKGLSPFTKERTPSFFVSPDRGLYHCFSSGKGGDMFTFLQEMEGVDFRGSLKMLAEKAGIPLEDEKPGERDLREQLYSALVSASSFFSETLKEKPEAFSYLKTRGLTEETISLWSLGYAPNAWHELRDFLLGKKFDDALLERAGLVKQQEKADGSVQIAEKAANSELPTANSRSYDRFRGRIMFPIKDISGRVIGFSGRIFEDDEKHPQAKYLNSPETPVFDKSRALYGLDKAREGIRELGAALLVEGQLDLLMAHQAGYHNAIATSGTAFTLPHVEIIKRYTQNLLIAYDGDRAGISAAGRAASIALQAGMNVKIVKLPPERDPADILLENKDVFRGAVKSALHVVDFYLAHIADAKYDPRTFRLEVSRTVLPYVAMIPHKIDQAHFIKRVAEVLQVGEDAVIAELKKVDGGQVAPKDQSVSANSKLLTSNASREPFLSRSDVLERLVYGLFLLFTEKKDKESADIALSALKGALGEERTEELLGQSTDTSAALFEADFFLESHDDEAIRREAVKEVYEALLKESRHERYREVVALLRVAETAHDGVQTEALMKELNALALRLH
ncbi:MAG: DNA primase [Candidatus Pacebacteria bacterium]|nr:DNA primase [Candidatus Paceibacterota bacterium]MBP9832106.1 DNA primase [Candidatus Paceibacterota bacterium]